MYVLSWMRRENEGGMSELFWEPGSETDKTFISNASRHVSGTETDKALADIQPV